MAVKKKAKKKTAKKRRRVRHVRFNRTCLVIAVAKPEDIDKHMPEGHELVNVEHLLVVGRKVWLLIVTRPKD